MANLLDETTGPVNNDGRNVHVIDLQLPVTTGWGSVLFEIALWAAIPLLTLLFLLVAGNSAGILGMLVRWEIP